MPFKNDKRNCLLKLEEFDKSRKGDVDKHVRPIIEYLNSLDDYYTTSSCSGRIILLTVPKSNKKHEFEWLFCKHDTITFEELKSTLPKAELTNELVWLRMEGPIIHVCCKTIDHANELLKIARSVGFKRSGIITLDRRVIVELESAVRADTMISINKKILVDDNYLQEFIPLLNQRLSGEFDRLKQLDQEIKKQIK
ncbi:hypothetical protein HOK51_05600 [Candidatus Woesearchaeota archaeon]|jgi:tRNA wybutosine-synthesizing protein 3|nr:hypothetical protein [Candidatus Woesearchaeota archaeon]MBT6519303.1 hypothetical protein [Candidatus Woesearchaeota archaeon]MBT7368956.1 hypothetical protein [Candidatus Woesearchaeota archaeon]